jgi:hypothetical protein
MKWKDMMSTVLLYLLLSSLARLASLCCSLPFVGVYLWPSHSTVGPMLVYRIILTWIVVSERVGTVWVVPLLAVLQQTNKLVTYDTEIKSN